jgi:hypothetical protein
MRLRERALTLTLLALFAGQAHASGTPSRIRPQDETSGPAQIDSATVARRLSNPNASERRAAAEELARLAAVEHRRLVEGYRVQEKDARVRLALEWALYRMGKDESLYSLVRALEVKKQSEQAVAYLKQIESPEPLYVFLTRVNGNTQIRLLEVLAAVGDRGTLAQIEPFTASLDPGIADAAKFAEREINIRLQETPAVEPKRQRKVGSPNETGPR